MTHGEWIFLVLGLSCGFMLGMVVKEYLSESILILCAQARRATKLRDGKFYYIVPEGEREL